MEKIELTEAQINNVKHVIFGMQKQANVQNEAVVKIVARSIIEHSGDSQLDSEESVVEGCRQYLQDCIDPDYSCGVSTTFVMLLAGETSLSNMTADGPKIVVVNNPNLDSPKHTFRIAMLGEDVSVDMSAEAGHKEPVPGTVDSASTSTDAMTAVTATYGERMSGGADGNIDHKAFKYETMQERAERVKKEILATVPTALAAEVTDEYARALCVAEYYYKNM